MNGLTSEKCTACRSDAPKVTLAEIKELKPKIPQWNIANHEGIPVLERAFPFKEYAQALAFTQKVGELAESEAGQDTAYSEYLFS